MNTITINGIKWKVKYTNDREKLRRDDGTYTIGVCDNNTKEIYIFAKLNESLFRDVLVHEITHAYVCSYGYKLSIEEEEFLCEFISRYSKDILLDAESILDKGMHKIIKKYL